VAPHRERRLNPSEPVKPHVLDPVIDSGITDYGRLVPTA
jgi:hypothetical protein